MGKAIIFVVLFVASVTLVIALLINGARVGIRCFRHKDRASLFRTFKKNAMFLGIAVFILIVFTLVTQMTVSTLKIRDNDGNVIEGSVAELSKINLNGRNEWISIRGKNKDAPVLLFLAGGPGGTQMAATRHELGKLEDYFVVVNWEQPGSGKSYHCMKRSEITVQTYIDDGLALTEYLCERFGKKQIYLMGESWGSALGIFLIHEKPHYYDGFIGTGQMVDFEETEIIDYNKAIEIAKVQGDNGMVEKLIKQGEPLYYDGNIAWKSATYLNLLSSYMAKNPDIYNGGYETIRDMFSSEYGIIDSINYMLGIMNTFNTVYPQLYDTDLREGYTKLEVPVYFFIGRHDINAPVSLAEDYYNRLEAPNKELVWFEHSGHSAWINETDKFVEETVRVFLK